MWPKYEFVESDLASILSFSMTRFYPGGQEIQGSTTKIVMPQIQRHWFIKDCFDTGSLKPLFSIQCYITIFYTRLAAGTLPAGSFKFCGMNIFQIIAFTFIYLGVRIIDRRQRIIFSGPLLSAVTRVGRRWQGPWRTRRGGLQQWVCVRLYSRGYSRGRRNLYQNNP